MGRPAKPVKDHLRDGTFQKVRHGNRAQFEAIKEVPKSPFSDKRRIQYWDHFCEKLITTGILTIQHLDAVETLCSLRSDYDDLDAQVRAEGATYTTDTGQKKPHPAYDLKLRVQGQIIRLYEQFGFTPRTSAGLKVQAEPETQKDPFEELLQMTGTFSTGRPRKQPKA